MKRPVEKKGEVMPSCEKCWEDSGGNPDRYRELIKKRECTLLG